MAMTVNESWKLRKKLVSRIRTYKQALSLFKYSEAVNDGSRAGLYHQGLGDVKTRQHPLVYPHWPRTYVGMLPPRVNASRIDHTMYTSNDQVDKGRIAFYYAPTGGYNRNGSRLAASLELVLWHPDGRCIVNPAVMEVYQWGRRARAEQFVDVSLWHLRGRPYIKLRKDAKGNSPSLWKQKPRKLPKNATGYQLDREIKDSHGNGTGTYLEWGMDCEAMYHWGAYTPLIVPSRRQDRPYLLRGTVDRDVNDHVGNLPTYLPSWSEERAEARKRTKVYRKMQGLMTTLRNNSELLRHFMARYSSDLGITADQLNGVFAESASTSRPEVEFLSAGKRHERRVFLEDH